MEEGAAPLIGLDGSVVIGSMGDGLDQSWNKV